MSSFIKDYKKRREFVPKWITYSVILLAFFFPLFLVIGENNLFDYILDFIKRLAGPNESYIHLLAYLICFLILLFPAVIFLQIIGHFKMMSNTKSKTDNKT